MNILSSSKEYTAYISRGKIFNEYPTPIADSLILAVMTGSSIAENVLAAQQNTFYNNVKKFKKYAENSWVYGLPSSNRDIWVAKEEDIAYAIRDYSGDPNAEVISYYYGAPDLDFITKNYLETYYGDIEGYYLLPDTTFSDELGTHTVSTIREYQNSEVENVIEFTPLLEIYDKYSINFKDTITTTTVLESVETTSIEVKYSKDTFKKETAAIVHVKYRSEDIIKYWIYSPIFILPYTDISTVELGDYPRLNPYIVETSGKSPFLPSIPLITNRKKVTSLDSSDSFRESVNTLGNILQLDSESILKSFTDNNDMSEVEDVFITFGLGLDTENKASVGYVFEFFNYLQEEYFYNTIPVDREGTFYTGSRGMEVSDGEYLYTLNWNIVAITENNLGVIGPIGSYKKEIVENYISTYSAGILGELVVSPNGPELVLRKQISDTHYKEIVLSGLSNQHIVTGRKTRAATYTIRDQQFLIPIHDEVIKKFTNVDKAFILLDSLNLVVYSLNVTETKWYESGIFSALLTIAAVVLAIPTGGASISWTAALKAVVISVVVSQTLELIGKAIGGPLGAIIATVGALYIGVKGIPGIGIKPLPIADAMLAGVNQLSNGFNSIVLDDYAEFSEEVDEFIKSSKEKTDELALLEEGLNDKLNDYLFNPLLIQRFTPYFNVNETPEDFFARNLETNPGVLSLDSISVWTDSMLELPKEPMYGLVPTNNKPIYGENYV